ncbi:MAG: NAD-dependent epimerase/dehydratase family protein [Alphaproteobacteria bacterium]|jgi:nucleoside-diphosphate-sugar epimerase|nr:NAD-dependent epimerase/dehydratase family protein [Alphaproteobacteria bacterium]MBT4086088.1 NAD-dependent epimerase/dehydratase family protein [Alphaproteobacteria bacterium]MBT4543705.1 NAD-dependent epimerase/dehydratase family protein [Alphaproteobacteria bacterium]MBT7743950.1 NAD-dependent epimerase/dehydratase family protein [Alphaproteobacteria bacterium]
MKRTALVTGATGFLGAYFTAHLLRQGFRVFALARNASERGLGSMILRINEQHSGPALDISSDFVAVEGDVRTQNCGLSECDAKEVAANVTDIWHFAAAFEDNGNGDNTVFETNVGGTVNLLAFLKNCKTSVRLNYVSTAYASPVENGVACEKLVDPEYTGASKSNAYENSKAEAERRVAALCGEEGIEYRIYRPPIVAGDSGSGSSLGYTGYQGVFRALYLLKRRLEINIGEFFDNDLRLRVIADPGLPVNVVPVDFVIESMWHLAETDVTASGIFNVTSQHAVKLETLFRAASESLGVTGISLSTDHDFDGMPMTIAERLFRRRMKFQEPYFLTSNQFDSRNFRNFVAETELPSPACEGDYLERCNAYCLNAMEQEFSAT